MTNIPVTKQESLSQTTNRNVSNGTPLNQTDPTSSNVQSRYWVFLFDNLKRSVEQIYQTCESDRDPMQCQDVLELLRQYCKDFERLTKDIEHLQKFDAELQETNRNYLSTSLTILPYQTESASFRPFEHSQSICNGELFDTDDFTRHQRRLHNSDINLNVHRNSYHYLFDTKPKRQKVNKSQKFADSSSLLSLPAFFSSALSNDSSATLIGSANQLLMSTSKRLVTEEPASDADDEKDNLDESISINRHHRCHRQLSSTSIHRLVQQNFTSEEDDDEILARNHNRMIDFRDQQIFDAFDQEESLTEALEAEQERTIMSLMVEQEDLEHQLNNVSDDALFLYGDEGSELEESELSASKTSNYFMSLHDDCDERDTSPNDLSREENDSEPDSKSRTKHLRIHEKLSTPSRIRPLSETLREAAERQERAFTRRQILRDEKARKMRELTHRVNEVRQWKEELIKARKTTIEMKMRRAEEKRHYVLFLRAKKAGDEDLKGQEIAFINCLQQENRRQTLKERYQKEEQLKQYLEEERAKKHDEHKQRELAAENRRKELEVIRQTRLNEMQEKWKIKERMIEQYLIERRRQKKTAAMAKQRNFQQKRAEHVAYLNATTVELKKRLELKQEESTRRHITQIEEIRRKAIEMSILRGPSAEDHRQQHPSPAPNDSKGTTSTTGISTIDESIGTRKFCTLCHSLLASDLHLQTHLRGTRHNQLLAERFNQKNESGTKKQPTQDEINTFNTDCITIVTNDDIMRQDLAFNRERKHAMKKRAKKLRLRMNQRSVAYEAENSQRPFLASTHKARIQRFLNELEKSLNTTTRKEPLNTTNYLACQRILTEFVKIFDTHGYEKNSPLEQRVFFSLNGYTTLTKMIELRAECNKPPLAPEGLIALTISVYRAATHNNVDNALYILNSGKILALVESLVRHLTGLKIDDLITSSIDQNESDKLAQIDLVANLTELIADLLITYNSVMREIRKRENETNDEKLTLSRLTDFISYMANVGVLDRIASFFRTARAIVNTTKSRVPDMIIHLLHLLQQMIDFSKPKLYQAPFGQTSKRSFNDSAQVLSIMKSTNYCEILSLLYGVLMHETETNSNNQMNTDHNSMTTVHEKTSVIVVNSMILLNTIAILDLDAFQTTLGEETISLQLRHVANYILSYCNHQQTTVTDTLLRQIILLVGYYSVLNQDNQCRLAFGNRPTVLQQLSCLPFRYFVETKYMDILFPTLIACSFDCDTTRAILQTEMSLDLIENFIQKKLTETTANHDDDILSTFHMRFPQDEWSNALKYYQSKSKAIINSIEPRESAVKPKQEDDKIENESHRNDNEIHT